MKLLLDFLCRFGWGMAVGLVLTPATIVPAGFFRVNLLVVLGLATGAALVAGGAATGRWTVAAAAIAAVTAWLGSVAWLGDQRRAGAWCCRITAACLAAAALSTAAPAGSPVVTLTAAEPLLSGLVSGLAVHAMLLGHWYLNAPGMRVDALRRMIDAALIAWAVRLAWSVSGFTPGWPDAAWGTTAAALTSLRWLAGLVGLPILLFMARKTLDIPNTQSATGILYVACLTAILGELTAQLLQAGG
ncbi:MAG: hypothetical protein FJ284_07135 [Planctomycetes bacterium]|nr:hypothetical protein [Planctomycetota bacterium]